MPAAGEGGVRPNRTLGRDMKESMRGAVLILAAVCLKPIGLQAIQQAEYGRMMFAGLSAYWRPNIDIGSDRPYDWSLEIGLKSIWR